MSCEMGKTIDFTSFLAEREDSRYTAFRKHYPGCPECSREVMRWGQLQSALAARAPKPTEHPAEEQMIHFASLPDSLEEAQRHQISAHLDDCASCRSELRMLRGFDLQAGVQSAMAMRSENPPRSRWHPMEALRAFAETLLGWLQTPALGAVAAAMAVAAIGWLSLRTPGTNLQPGTEMQRAQIPVTAPVELAREHTGPRREASPSKPHAAQSTPTSVDVQSQPEPTSDGPQIAATAKRAQETRGVAQASQPEEAVAGELTEPLPPEGIQIAARLPELPISYSDPADPLFATGPVRSFGVSRARGPSPSLEVRVMAPEHVGYTAASAPTLYWELSEAVDLPMEITLLDDAQVEPLLEERREGPHASGLQAISLADSGIRLKAGVLYRWQVALVVDPKRRSKDVRSAAAVVWKPSESATLPPTSPGRAHQLAASGYWYDAFSQLSAWLAAEPDAGNLLAARHDLLEQVGLRAAGPGPRP